MQVYFFKALYSLLTLLTIHSANLNKNNCFIYIFKFECWWYKTSLKGFESQTHRCFWQCSPTAVGIWSVSAFLLEWCLWVVACGTGACSLPPERNTQHTSVFERHLLKHFLFFPFWFHGHAGTSMKELKRGSFFCLFLIWSKAHDWWLQNRAVSFWNHSPSVPSNLQFNKGRKKEIRVVHMKHAAFMGMLGWLTLLSSVVPIDLTMKLSSKRSFFRLS